MDVKKINFRQPKYLLPAILYFPILFVGYFVIDMFQTDVSSNKTDPRLKTTDYLSGDLPEANTDSLLGDKMNNTEREFGQISDLSGVNSLEMTMILSTRKRSTKVSIPTAKHRLLRGRKQRRRTDKPG